jgi:GTP-binding protein EngB required for normal cell division
MSTNSESLHDRTLPEIDSFLSKLDLFKQEVLKRIGTVNILVVGGTGVGKSSLVNAIFGERYAKTAVGRPVTQEIKRYQKKGEPVGIYDTVGLELQDYKKILKDLIKLVEEKNKNPEASEHIHIAWLCIQENTYRVEDAHKNLAKELHDHGVPVIVILTKCISEKPDEKATAFVEIVQKEIPSAINIVRLRSEELVDADMNYVKPLFGLDDLVEITNQVIPDVVKIAFAASQKIKIDLKKAAARTVLIVYSTAAAGGTAAVGWIPSFGPLASEAIKDSLGYRMLVSVSHIFFEQSFERDYWSELLLACATTEGFNRAASKAFEFFLSHAPGMQIATAAIASIDGFSATYAMGLLVIEICSRLVDPKDPEKLPPIEDFKNELNKEKNLFINNPEEFSTEEKELDEFMKKK